MGAGGLRARLLGGRPSGTQGASRRARVLLSISWEAGMGGKRSKFSGIEDISCLRREASSTLGRVCQAAVCRWGLGTLRPRAGIRDSPRVMVAEGRHHLPLGREPRPALAVFSEHAEESSLALLRPSRTLRPFEDYLPPRPAGTDLS